MESKNLLETERLGDVYVVSAETSIDLNINVKIEPEDNDNQDVVVEDKAADYKETEFNETSVSSTTNFATVGPSMEAERTETEFQLKFDDEIEPEALLTVKKPSQLHLTVDRYVSRSFDVIARRKNYKYFPIQWYDRKGRPAAPFIINGAREVTYGPIAIPKGGDVIHQGASIKVENAKAISMTFETVGTYLTGDEKEVKKMRMHTAKHLELLCLDQEDGSILGSIDLQVVVIKRPKQKPVTCKPIESEVESMELSLDSEEAESLRRQAIIELEEMIPRISTINLTYIVTMAKAMADK